MKRSNFFLLVLTAILALAFTSTAFAQDSTRVRQQNHKSMKAGNKQHGKMMKGKQHQGFVDENGDGYNDHAMDSDGDGIPNGRDEDYTGSKMRHGNHGKGFVDADGDGINDNAMDDDGDGVPNGQDPDFQGHMRDGSGQHGQMGNGGHGNGMKGQGKGMGNGGGDCDGSGPKGGQGKGGGRN